MLARLHKPTFQLLTLIAALTVVTPAIGKDTLTLNFGVFSTNNPTSVVRQYMPALKELEQSMTAKLDRTVDIRMHISSERGQGAFYLNQGNVDFASLNNESYLKSKSSNPKLRILAAQNAMNSTTLTPWVARAGMHDSIFMALRESLFNIKNSKVLTGLKAFGFVQSHDSQYAIYSTEPEYAAVLATSKTLSARQIQASRVSKSEPTLLGVMQAGAQVEKVRRKTATELPQDTFK
jgi:ABC-type phosphate/phosphonate transport system substrate-binding protein